MKSITTTTTKTNEYSNNVDSQSHNDDTSKGSTNRSHVNQPQQQQQQQQHEDMDNDNDGMIFRISSSSSSTTRSTGPSNRPQTTSSKSTSHRRSITNSNNIIHTWYLHIKIVSIPVGLLVVFGLCCISNVVFHRLYTVNTILYSYSTRSTTRSNEQQNGVIIKHTSSNLHHHQQDVMSGNDRMTRSKEIIQTDNEKYTRGVIRTKANPMEESVLFDALTQQEHQVQESKDIEQQQQQQQHHHSATETNTIGDTSSTTNKDHDRKKENFDNNNNDDEDDDSTNVNEATTTISSSSSSNNDNDTNNSNGNGNNINDNNNSNDKTTEDNDIISTPDKKSAESSNNTNEKSSMPPTIPPEVLCILERATNNDEESCYNEQHHPPITLDTSNRSIIFIHVGKAGGETIKNAIEIGCEMKNLRKQEICYNNLPPSELSNTIHGYIHGVNTPKGRKDIIATRIPNNQSLTTFQKNFVLVDQSTTFLYNLRHPYDRTKSWYSFVAPQNCNRTLSTELLGPLLPSCRFQILLTTNPDYIRSDNGKLNYIKIFFDTCYPTLQDFATATFIPKVVPIYNTDPYITFRDVLTFHDLQSGIIQFHSNDTTGNTVLVNCTKMVEYFIQGNRLIISKFGLLGQHMRANYQFYYHRTIEKYPHREIFVVRTNTLWDDLKQLDRIYLNGTGIFSNVDGSQTTHGSEQHQIITRTASSDATKFLCCALRTELVYYKYLLYAASNLPVQEKQRTWENDINQCGFDTWYDYETYCSSTASNKNMYIYRDRKEP